jgi:hypothetical protein
MVITGYRQSAEVLCVVVYELCLKTGDILHRCIFDTDLSTFSAVNQKHEIEFGVLCNFKYGCIHFRLLIWIFNLRTCG